MLPGDDNYDSDGNVGELVPVSYTHLDVYKRQNSDSCFILFGYSQRESVNN